jgi:hypothetical protein
MKKNRMGLFAVVMMFVWAMAISVSAEYWVMDVKLSGRDAIGSGSISGYLVSWDTGVDGAQDCTFIECWNGGYEQYLASFDFWTYDATTCDAGFSIATLSGDMFFDSTAVGKYLWNLEIRSLSMKGAAIGLIDSTYYAYSTSLSFKLNKSLTAGINAAGNAQTFMAAAVAAKTKTGMVFIDWSWR